MGFIFTFMRGSMQINDFSEFTDYVSEHLFDGKPELGIGREVKVVSVNKNNGVVLTGINVREEHSNVAPTIYLNGFFDMFESGEDIEGVLKAVLSAYESSTQKGLEDFDIEKINHFETVKDRLEARLINGRRNADRLEGFPHYKFGDLALVFYIFLVVNGNEAGAVSVTNDLMKEWGVELSELLETALRNMSLINPPSIDHMETFLLESFSAEKLASAPDDVIELLKERSSRKMGSPGMYILTNKTRMNGAVGLVFPEIISSFAKEAGTDVFILPSSIHECILLPDDGMCTVDELRQMVENVNLEQVPTEEILSDNVYVYRLSSGCIHMAETGEPFTLEDVTKGFTCFSLT